MTELKTERQFQERFLDGYDRSQLRQAVQRVKPARMSGMRKKYAGLVLGASLALGGLGIPLKVSHMLEGATASPKGDTSASATAGASSDNGLESDLSAAQSIAREVTGGVEAAAGTAGVGALASKAADAVSQVTEAVSKPAEAARKAFFNKEVPFGGLIYNEAKKNDLSPELVAAVVHTESKFVPTARSGRGALGLMQLVPRTARWMGARDPMNPNENVAAGAKYLRYLSDRFDGNQEKMIAAYNAGEGNVRRFNGVPPFRETQNYVQRVQSFKQDLDQRSSGQVAELTGADAIAR